ncbi:Unconventional myosin-X [Aphelenchoides bicaudatus]|nr:Unconventional myosin-X [Aphelenchoides bicaudatus]
MVILVPGDHIWIEAQESNSKQFSTPIGAKVLHAEDGQVVVVDDDGRETCLNEQESVRVMHQSSIEGVENLIDLGDLHEAAILRNLLVRFRDRQKRIYTFVGSILVAVNPHEQLNIYTLDFQVTAADRLKLIKLVSERPMIWDSNIKGSKDQVQTGWQGIALELSTPGRNFDVFLIKKVWSCLRGEYSKNKKDVYSKWQYLRPLSFLEVDFDAKEAAKFMVTVSDGSETKQVETQVNQKCGVFYRFVRRKLAIDQARPFSISTSRNRVVSDSNDYTIGDFGIVNGELLRITIGISSAGRVLVLSRTNRTFNSFVDASKYLREYNFDNDYVFAVYLVVSRVSPLQAAALKIHSDYFNLAVKCGTTQRQHIKGRFYEQRFNDKEHKQILIASCTNEQARALGFSSAETWAYALELALGRLRGLFKNSWNAGTKSRELNNLCIQQAGGRFTAELCYETLLKLIKNSVDEDVERAKLAAFRAGVLSQTFISIHHRYKSVSREGAHGFWKTLGELPAHVFAIAENALADVCQKQYGQLSVIISGESGSGKTESSKLILHYLAAVCRQHSFVEQQLLEANPIIEAFGNACTVYNNNSSRFGKYTKIFLDQNGRIKGARLTKFLLEKSRVAQPKIEERNFHIFYMLLALTAKERYELDAKSISIDGRNDAAELKLLREALKILSFSPEEIWQIFSVLAALLHLGNLQYTTTTKDNMEVTELDDTQNVARIAKLLQVESKHLVKALTSQTISAGKETIRRNLSTKQSFDQRDSLIKTVYNLLFEYIIEFVNETLGASLSEDECKTGTNAHNYRAIGILDIFGFENLRENSFEQLCVNHSNELLQQFFTRQIFKLEQSEYEAQQIGWQHLDYVDNQPVINLLAASHLGIFQLIDEESILPQGTDDSLLQKLHANHSEKSSEYMKPSSNLIKQFGIRHYVGGFVSYSTKDFLSKNRDSFGSELRHLVGTSRCKLVRKIFNCANHPLLQTQAETQKQTVGQAFRKSLKLLVSELENTEPLFIRCLRPNDQKLPHVFDRSTVLRQIRNLGLNETTTIRQAGYAIRHDYRSFVQTYYGLVSNLDTSDCIRASEKILTIILGDSADFKMGKTKIFLKNDDDVYLQREREKMLDFYATSIQKNFQAYAKRRRFLKMRHAALLIQTTWRAFVQRKKYKQILNGISRLQAILRSHQLVDRYDLLREQACCRGALLRKRLAEIAHKKEMSTELGNGVENGVESGENGFNHLADDETSENNLSNGTPTAKPSKLSTKVLKKLDRFAAINFQDNANFRHTTQVLRKSLLEHQCVGDKMAALAIWIHVLRFMRDLPEPEPTSHSRNGQEPTQPIMNQLYQRIYKNSNAISNGKSEKSLFKNQRVDSYYDTFSRSSSKCSSATLKSDNWFTNEPLSQIDRVHFIVGHGILRPSLRNEIYCQLMKQLIENSSPVSCERGWLLLSLCLSSFQPSFAAHVKEFISEAPIHEVLLERFERCAQKGTRCQPPSYLEFQAAKSEKTKFVVNVTFMDGLVKTINADSSTTAHEVCGQLAEKIQLKDRFGFSLYITMDGKVTSLGAGNDFLLDAISQSEQIARSVGHDERNAQWRLFYRKELFNPWNVQSTDPVANSLIYEQIIRGIHYNEYRCSESELALLAAQQFFVQQNGQVQMEADILEKQLTSLLPEAIVTKNKTSLDTEKWLQLIMNVYRKAFPQNTQYSVSSVKKDVCQFAAKRWSLLFSRFYEAYKFSGPPLPKNEVILAVNSIGFYILDSTNQQILLECPFSQIMGVVSCLSKRMGADSITIQLLSSDEYTFQSENAEDIRELIVFFLEGLRKRSKHFLIVEPFRKLPNQKWLDCKEGDLLKIVDDLENEEDQDDCVFVTNMRTNEKGYVPTDQLYIIPCVEDPPVGLLDEMRRRQELKVKKDEVEEFDQQIVPVFNNCTFDLVRLPVVHTLQKYARDHFRPNDSIRELWRHAHEPLLRRPLLKQTEPRLEVFEMYVGIMKFMGDLPMIEPFNPTNLTTHIFTPPLKLTSLRDEFYCQLMKQLTDNHNPVSEQRGYQLMWLAVGLFGPSKELNKELVQFLNSRRSPRTAECISRLNKTMRCGRNLREHPPHQVEVDAIFSRTTQIFHKVFLPDGTTETPEVESSSKAVDLCKQLGLMLGFKSVNGFSLFVKLGDKAVSIPEQEFFFDFITQVTQWARQNQPTKPSTSTLAYQVIFMRKLWLNVKPGWDLAADLFHYYQEIPKYLHGFYAISRQDAIKLASLILKAQTKDNKEPPFGHFQQIINDLIPKDLLKTQSVGEWKKQITAEYQQVTAKNALEAKVQFLKAVSQFTTFGSAFFEVKQSSDTTMASKIILAINQHGVTVLDHTTKKQIASHPFSTIVNWTAGNTYFHLTFGNIVKGGRLLVETSLGYKLDDLLASYLQQFLHDSSKPNKNAVAYIENTT